PYTNCFNNGLPYPSITVVENHLRNSQEGIDANQEPAAIKPRSTCFPSIHAASGATVPTGVFDGRQGRKGVWRHARIQRPVPKPVRYLHRGGVNFTREQLGFQEVAER